MATFCWHVVHFFFFFFNDTATTEIYTLSLHDALPIYSAGCSRHSPFRSRPPSFRYRSEEHTSELQSLRHLVCRLLLEKKKITQPLTIRPRLRPGGTSMLSRSARA